MWDWRTRCLQAYAEHCYATLEVPTDEEADAWLHEWAELEAEDQEDAVDAYWAEQRDYFRDGV